MRCLSQGVALCLVILATMTTTTTDALFQSFTKGATSSSTRTIAVTGATGLVGKRLCESLRIRGITVRPISTRTQDIDGQTFAGCDAIVHLAGENIASGSAENPFALLGAWTPRKKEQILNSRVDGTRAVVAAINSMKSKPKAFICASAVGLYGFKDNEGTVFSESDGQGGGFLAQVGGVLAKLLPIFKLAAGGNLGSGKQGFSWVTIDDAVRAIEFSLDKTSVSGAINVASPEPVTNAEFTSALGKAVNRPAIFPVPEIIGSLVFGEFGAEVLFGGQKVVPTKLTKAGFKFDDVYIDSAINRLING